MGDSPNSNPNDPFLSGTGGGSGTEQAVQNIVSKIIGQGDIQQALSKIISTGLNSFTAASAGGVAYGQNALFKQQDVGMNLLRSADQLTMNGTMAGSQLIIEQARIQQAENMQRAFGSNDPKLDAAGFNMTNLASWGLFSQRQSDQFQAGLEISSRYMGAASTAGLSAEAAGRVAQRNLAIGGMNAAITKSWTDNSAGFGGLGGKDVGRVMAELGRTGQLNRFINSPTGGQNAALMEIGDLSQSGADNDRLKKILETRTQELRQYVQDASRTVASYKSVFNGTVEQMTDQANALVGADMLSTFGPNSRMVRNLGTTGVVSGYTSDQMVAFAAQSNQLSTRYGRDTFGSMSVGSEAALRMAGSMQNGAGANAFFNEREARDNMVRVSTAAQHSILAGNIAGAASMLMLKDPTMTAEEAAAKLAGADSMGEIRRRLGAAGIDASASQITRASGGTRAKEFKASGAAQKIVTDAQIAKLEGQVDRGLSNTGGMAAKLNAAFKKFGDGPVSPEELQRAASGDLSDYNNKPKLQAALRKIRRDYEIAEISASEGDIAGVGDRLAGVNELAGGSTGLSGVMAGTGDRVADLRNRRAAAMKTRKALETLGVGGFMGLNRLFSDNTGMSKVDLSTIWGELSGNTDLTDEQTLELYENSGEGRTRFNKQLNNIQDPVMRARIAAAVSTVGSALGNGTYRGKTLTMEQRKKMSGLLELGEGGTIDTKRQEELLKFSNSGGEVFEKAIITSIANNMVLKSEKDKTVQFDQLSDDVKQQARSLKTYMETGDVLDTEMNKKGVTDEKKAKLKAARAAVSKITQGLSAQGATEESVMDDLELEEDVVTEIDSAKRQAAAGANIGPSSKIEEILNKILTAIEEWLNTAPQPAKT